MDATTMPGCDLKALKEAVGKLSLGQALNPNQAGTALNVLNTIRVINSLAVITDIPDRIEIPGLDRIPPSTWRREFERVFAPKV